MFVTMKVRFRKTFVIAILYQGLLLLADYIAFSINGSLFSNYDMTLQFFKIESMLVIIFSKVILYICILIIKKKMGHKSTEILTDVEWIRFLFFPIFTILTVTGMIAIIGYEVNQIQIRILLIIALGMVAMNIVVFYLINDIVKRELQIRKKEMFEVEVKNQTQMYKTISENYDKQRSKVHEFKNEILCIESLLIKKQYEELEKYIRTISVKLRQERDAINTNNVIINAIINTKYQEAINKGIVFVFRVNDLSTIKVTDEDIVVILANLLNNAIEACEKCSNQKVIKLKFIKEEDGIILSVKNTCSEPPIFENGRIKTSKLLEPEEHGIGIKNIITIIEKYNGSYVIKNNDSEFYFSILIPVD
ncbi:GHKL domain-containing protein [Candidatus Galacturonibacter soehngenii]|uniref:GHKL domain-containing protein n=2 Tax=Candidatus Galacturonatibacter soehngenii TaxID=2307010 RepID=A0A7V7UCK8_9FIRM|nr:GHKL domain-containing protein [Candidatus Galacturonibacter soehngenii]